MTDDWRAAIRAVGPLVRAQRFAAVGGLVARIYAGYKAIQARAAVARRVGGDGDAAAAARYARHHRRSAEGAYRLATRLEGLPIKVCQFVGSRADVLPLEYVEVLSKLQDRVPPRPLPVVADVLARELGPRWRDAIPELDPTPLASASLAQVHRGRLADGREVAVKVQYPGIEGLVAVDLRNFAFLVRVLARLEPQFDFRVIIDEVERYVPLELDFEHEAANAARMRANLATRTDVVVPEVVSELSTRRVLVMDYQPGARLTDLDALARIGVDPKDLARRMLDLFCEQILIHGFFHADPHPGNVLVRDDGKIVLLDFGLAKDLPPDFRDGIARLTMAIMGGDRAGVAAAFRALGFATRDQSDESLFFLGEAFLGYALRNRASHATPEMVNMINAEMPRIMRANPLVQIPGHVLLIARVLGLLSGVAKQLGSNVDPAEALMPYLMGTAFAASARPSTAPPADA